jgi:dTDP-4-dehydrorhamnose reductase
MRAVVIGGSGQIGSWLLRHLNARGHEASGTYNTVPYPGLVHLDGADLASGSTWLRSERPDVVFFPAGFTYVDGCERDPAKALAANRDQPLALARVAAEQGARFVYFSTDYVFDGEHGPDAEDAPTRPLNAYGSAKLEAERSLMGELGDAVLVARTSWVYGPERQGKNFAYQLARSLREGKSLTVPTDMISNPSYGPDVAKAAVLLVEKGVSGLLHVAGPQVMPRVEFARALAEGFGLDPGLIIGHSTAEIGGTTPRPLSGGLRTDRLEAILPGLMKRAPEAIADFRALLAADEGFADPTR